MIISASRRTDIPALYAEWLENRVREGFLCVRNPMNAHQVSRISLAPEVVDCIVFWTKNPAPMLPRLDAFSAYQQYFQVTLTGYGRDAEAGLPDKRAVLIPAFQELSRRLGAMRTIWRYDPILFNGKYTPAYHLRAFRAIAQELEGHSEKCVISFVDAYAKNRRALERLQPQALPEDELRAFCAELAAIAGEHGMAVGGCAEQIDLADCGIEHNCCIDRALIERIMGAELDVAKDKTQRLECGCAASIDIGAYNTCTNGCTYCYANFSPKVVARARAAYDPASPLLCGTLGEDDIVRDRPMRSLIKRQAALGI